jgi:hypothetical protein
MRWTETVAHMGMRNRILVGTFYKKRQYGRLIHMYEDYVKLYFKGTECASVD